MVVGCVAQIVESHPKIDESKVAIGRAKRLNCRFLT